MLFRIVLQHLSEEQMGKKASQMFKPSYYLCITGDVIGDPVYQPVVDGQSVHLKVKLRG